MLTEEHQQLRKLPLLQYLSTTCKLFMLNEVEIVTWYCFLKRQRYNVQSVENIIKCAAYCAKEQLNDEH